MGNADYVPAADEQEIDFEEEFPNDWDETVTYMSAFGGTHEDDEDGAADDLRKERFFLVPVTHPHASDGIEMCDGKYLISLNPSGVWSVYAGDGEWLA
jgi:hypothetical protein